ncbi:MAG: hypothetical protein AAFS11_02330 [Planctomycetota bacterium]
MLRCDVAQRGDTACLAELGHFAPRPSHVLLRPSLGVELVSERLDQLPDRPTPALDELLGSWVDQTRLDLRHAIRLLPEDPFRKPPIGRPG